MRLDRNEDRPAVPLARGGAEKKLGHIANPGLVGAIGGEYKNPNGVVALQHAIWRWPHETLGVRLGFRMGDHGS